MPTTLERAVTAGDRRFASLRFSNMLFVDDFFRSSTNGLAYGQDNRRYLSGVFGSHAATRRLGVAELSAVDDGYSHHVDVARAMRALDLPTDEAGWARACVSDLQGLVDLGILPRLSSKTLVIGWGLTPALMHWLDTSGVSFIDCEISPKRFATNLAFCMRSNDTAIAATIRSLAVDEAAMANEAAILRGYFARRGEPTIHGADRRVGLFCGQTLLDLALVSDGKLRRPIEVIDQVRELASSVDVMLFKPHPYEPRGRLLRDLASHIDNAAWTTENYYALLCARNLHFACALTSGAMLEAQYFGKRGICLVDPDRNNPERLPASCSPWVTVRADALSIDAMDAFCHGLREVDLWTQGVAPDALDRAFGVRWGLDHADPGLKPVPQLQEGSTHRIGTGDGALAWLGPGWHLPEGTGTWTAEGEAHLHIPLSTSLIEASSPMTLELHGSIFTGVEVRCAVNGWSHQVFSTECGPFRAQLEVDARNWRQEESVAPRLLHLILSVTGARSPRSLGQSEDDRQLGLHLMEVRLRAGPAEEPAPVVIEQTAIITATAPMRRSLWQRARGRLVRALRR